VIATWVHNEPSALTIIQESKLPDSFYQVVEQGIEPMIEVFKSIV
jgi:E3 ubiquitin-protein ligase HUWE1